MKNPRLIAAAAVLLTASSAFASDWTIDPAHSNAQFAIRHLMVATVRGEFQKVTGTVKLDDQDLTKSQVNVSIDPATINTREPKRDEHLKSPDFFDVQKFPAITFKSTQVTKGTDGAFQVTGDLTMHGVTKPVTLTATVSDAVKNPWGQTVRGVSATGTLNRKDFGLGWNKALEAGGVMVGDEVKLTIDAELNLVQPKSKT